MHRAPAPARRAVDAPEELRHDALGVCAAGDRVPVGAVGADQVVLGSHHRGRPDDRRLLADREVQEAADLGALVLAPGLLLEAADDRHRAQEFAARVRVGKVDPRAARPVGDALRRLHLGLGLLLRHVLRTITEARSRYPAAAPAASSSRSSPQKTSTLDDDRGHAPDAEISRPLGRLDQARA